MRGRRFLLLATALCSASLAACEYDRVAVPEGKPRVLVHAVLDPTIFQGESFYVLVERTLSGRVNIDTTRPFDPADPIVTGSGDPASGATVRIYYRYSGPLDEESVATGIEVAQERSDGKGRGVYRFIQHPGRNPAAPPPPPWAVRVYRGGPYRLEVNYQGQIVTGETFIPSGIALPDSGPFRFNRDSASVRLGWLPVDSTKRYLLRIDTPYGPFTIFTDSLSFTVGGDLRNFAVERFPRVLVPGFQQRVLVAAVDRNYFDYYRSYDILHTATDPFSGNDVIDHLEGGTGVFGALLPIRRYVYDVVATVDEPIEGTWERQTREGVFEALSLYADGPELLTGSDGPFFDRHQHGVLGSRSGNQVTLNLLRKESASDTLVKNARGVLRGDTLDIAPWIPGETSVRFFRRKTP